MVQPFCLVLNTLGHFPHPSAFSLPYRQSLFSSTLLRNVGYYAIGVYSEQLADGSTNGIPVFDAPWKNVVATFYHELNEARTDADVEDAIRAGNDPSATKFLGWVSRQ